MAKKPTPKIVDVTVKEGGFGIHHRIKPEQSAGLAREIERSGLNFMEISHGCGAGGLAAGYPGLVEDEELLRAARQAAPSLKYSVFFSSSPHAIPEIQKLSPYFEMGKVGVNVDEPKKIREHIKQLKGANKQVAVQLLRIHTRSPECCAEASRFLQDEGCDVLYLTDSFGSLGSQDLLQYLETVQAACTLPLGFSGRNQSCRAMDNALKAFDQGVEWFDASLLGMGPGGGVVALEILVGWLQKLGYCAEIDLMELANAARWHAHPMIRKFPYPRQIDLLTAQWKIDYYPQEFLEKISEIVEMPLSVLFTNLRKAMGDSVQLRETHLRSYLQNHGLDFDVVLHYLRTGEIPESPPPP